MSTSSTPGFSRTARQADRLTASSPDPNRWKALAVCLVGGAMVLLDVSIVNVALRSISVGLHASGDALQWVLSGYSLTFGLLLVPAGRLGDARGRRRLFIFGMLAFTFASVLCGAAPNADLAGDRPVEPGAGRGPADAPDQRADPAAVPRPGAGQGLRAVRCHGRHLDRAGPADRRPADPDLRRVRRLALRVLRQPADRPDRGAVRDAAAAAGHRPSSAAGSTTWTRSGCCCSAPGVVVLLLPFVQEQQWQGNAKVAAGAAGRAAAGRLPGLGGALPRPRPGAAGGPDAVRAAGRSPSAPR